MRSAGGYAANVEQSPPLCLQILISRIHPQLSCSIPPESPTIETLVAQMNDLHPQATGGELTAEQTLNVLWAQSLPPLGNVSSLPVGVPGDREVGSGARRG